MKYIIVAQPVHSSEDHFVFDCDALLDPGASLVTTDRIRLFPSAEAAADFLRIFPLPKGFIPKIVSLGSYGFGLQLEEFLTGLTKAITEYQHGVDTPLLEEQDD